MDGIDVARQLEARERNLESALSTAVSAARAAREGGAGGPLEVECYQDAVGNWVAEARRPQGLQEGEPDAFILRMDGLGRGADTEAPDQGRSRLFGPAPLNLDKAREYAGSSLHRARVKGEVGPLEVDCLQSQSGHWFCEVARPRGPREGPEDVFILHPASRASRPDIGAGLLTMFARGYSVTDEGRE